jgi:hypothetical protein
MSMMWIPGLGIVVNAWVVHPEVYLLVCRSRILTQDVFVPHNPRARKVAGGHRFEGIACGGS